MTGQRWLISARGLFEPRVVDEPQRGKVTPRHGVRSWPGYCAPYASVGVSPAGASTGTPLRNSPGGGLEQIGGLRWRESLVQPLEGPVLNYPHVIE